jgi:hypothetical protein
MDGQGMPAWAVSVLKWSAALLALVLLVVFAVPRLIDEVQGAVSLSTGEEEDLLPSADPADTEPESLEEGEVVAVSDLGVSRGTIVGRAAATIELGGAADEILVAFDAIPADTACLTEVVLEAYLVETTGTDVLLLPAATDLPGLEDGQALPPDAIISGRDPVPAVAGEGTAGWLRWDATGPYTLAARSAGETLPVVLALTTPEEGIGTATFGTTDSPEEWSPRLIWAAVEGCSETGRGTAPREVDEQLEQEAGDGA